MASGSALALLSTLLLALPGTMTSNIINGELKNENVNTATQKEIEHEIKGNAASVNQTKSRFVPSFHLGPIDTFIEPSNNLRKQTSKSPFNGEQGARIVSDRSNSPFNSVRPIKFDNVHNDYNNSEMPMQKQIPFKFGEKDENFVKFVYDKKENKEDGGTKDQNIFKLNHRYSQLPSRFEQSEYFEGNQHPQDITYGDENYGTGQQYVTYEVKPSKFHDHPIYSVPNHHVPLGDNHFVQYHPGQLETFQVDEKFVKPETVINVHPMSYQATSFDLHTKPKTVVYVTSHETSLGKQYPYQYYQPSIFDHTVNPNVVTDVVSEPHQYPLFYEHQNKSIVPWKKIFHIIGAFLPLGLLFALLSPKVVNAGQNGDPNIVLSKLRINDLQPEHKQSRLVLNNDKEDECIKRSICRVVAATDSDNSNFLQHLLRQVTARTPESAVRKKELERIFEAAKLGNCDILTCSFYDGT